MSVDEVQVDLPAADPERVTAQLVSIFDILPDDVIHISAKTGYGVQGVIDAIISRIPAPTGSEALPLRARLFDSSYVESPLGPWAVFRNSSSYDRFRGVISLLRIQDGVLKRGALRSTPQRNTLISTLRRQDCFLSFSEKIRRDRGWCHASGRDENGRTPPGTSWVHRYAATKTRAFKRVTSFVSMQYEGIVRRSVHAGL